MPEDEAVVDLSAGSLVRRDTSATIRVPCNAAAPLVGNGVPYIGCTKDKGHEPPHRVEVSWR